MGSAGARRRVLPQIEQQFPVVAVAFLVIVTVFISLSLVLTEQFAVVRQ